MTITDKTLGTATTGNNASVTPGTPSGLLAGDFVLIAAAIRNNGVGSVNTPTGWQKIAENQNLALLGRYFQTGDTMPLVTFTGGVANADTYARAIKLRGVAKDMLTEVVADTAGNGSQQNINTAGVTVVGDNHAVLQFVWKQDDATSLSTPATFIADGLTNMTTGDDMLAALFSVIQTTAASVSTGTITVTGGVAAIGRAITLAIRPAPAITISSYDLFPPRNAVTLTGLTPGDDVAIYRVVAGQRTLLRDGVHTAVTDPGLVVVDGELPFGVSVSYVAVVNSSAEYESAAAEYSLPGGKPILSDAVSGESSQFTVVSWPRKEYKPQASLFKVGGRNVVVSGDVGQFESQMEIFFEAWSSSENFLALLNSATEGVLQLRAPVAGYNGVDCYLAILSASEDRFSQDGTDDRRTWVLEVAETESWSDGFTARAFTWADVVTFYTGLTWADLIGDHATWLAVQIADFTP